MTLRFLLSYAYGTKPLEKRTSASDSVSALSRDLSLGCVVEGVETNEQLALSSGIGCHLIQGYFDAKPMKLAEVAGVLETRRQQRSDRQNAA